MIQNIYTRTYILVQLNLQIMIKTLVALPMGWGNVKQLTTLNFSNYYFCPIFHHCMAQIKNVDHIPTRIQTCQLEHSHHWQCLKHAHAGEGLGLNANYSTDLICFFTSFIQISFNFNFQIILSLHYMYNRLWWMSHMDGAYSRWPQPFHHIVQIGSSNILGW